jgi:hypothetical protein
MSSHKESASPRVVEYKDFTKAALARMLAEADAGQRFASMPIHKRRLATEDEDEDDDEMSKEADADREARADLAESTRPGNAPPVDPSDLPRIVSKRYSAKKKPRGK